MVVVNESSTYCSKNGKCLRICSKFSLKCEESHTTTEIVDFVMLIISCLFLIGRVGTYRQVLHLFRKLQPWGHSILDRYCICLGSYKQWGYIIIIG